MDRTIQVTWTFPATCLLLRRAAHLIERRGLHIGQGGRLRQDDSTYNSFSLWEGGLGQDDSTYNSLWRSSIQILLWGTKPLLLNVIWFINHPFSTYRRLPGRCHPFFK